MPHAARQTDALIIGAGIAGAALACALRDSGLDVLLLEKSTEPLDTARGDHLQPRSAEILDHWGVLDDFFAAGAEKRLGSVWFDAGGEPLLSSRVADLDLPYPYYLYLNHEAIGATLLEAALCSASVELVRPIRNWWREEEAGASGRTRVRVAPEAGEEFVVDARVVVGADGRSSRVRSQFGFAAKTYRYERPIVVMFGEVPRRNADNELEAHLNEEQMVAVIPRTGGGSKIGVPVDQDDVAAWRRADADELRRRINELAPSIEIERIEFSDVYPPVFLHAESWVDGNVVLIGDAAHAMHPARSQGMNVAIRLVHALAGSLEICRVNAADVGAALADYEQRLKPGVDAMLATNHEHGLAMDRSGSKEYAQTCAALRAVQADPAVRHAFAMNSAGYPPSIPAD